MAEYIEREAALSALLYVRERNPIEDIKSIPAADVVPVVRCKDCRYGYDSVGGWCCSHGICVDCIVREDFFCADGARMDLGTDCTPVKDGDGQ